MNFPVCALLVFFYALSGSGLSEAAGIADPIELKVGMGLAKPPYIMKPGESGLEYEIADKALALAGYKMMPQYFPQARALGLMQAGQLDAMLGVTEGIGGHGFFSNTYIVYQNVAVTLTSRHISLSRIEDLADYSVAAFQNARFVLGDRFNAVVGKHHDYTEHPQQITQNRLLYTGRVDVVVGDRLIFHYFNNEVEKKIDTSQPVTFHQIFPPSPRQVVFQDKAVRDKFNAGLKMLKQDGTYAAILLKYQKLFDY